MISTKRTKQTQIRPQPQLQTNTTPKNIVPPPPPFDPLTTTNPEATHSVQYPTSNLRIRHQLKHRSAEIAHARRPDPGANDPALWLRCDDGSISAPPCRQCPGSDWHGCPGNNMHVRALT